VSYADMMREFGAAGCFIVAYFLTMAFMTVSTVFLPPDTALPGWTVWLPLIVSVVAAVAFFAAYQSFGRPMFVFLLVVMILLATTELGVDSWVVDLMTPVLMSFSAKGGAMLLVYTAVIMTVLRFCAGPIVHQLSPLGLLATCAAIAALGLLFLSAASTPLLVFLAATMYGVGKTFFWPTTLGVVAEQFPKGGALTLNAMGGMGMIAVGVLGGPLLGTLQDRALDQNLERKNTAIHTLVAREPTSNFGISYRPLDKSRIAALPKEQQDEVNKVIEETKHGMLGRVAVLPAIMFICYIGLIIYFKARGGYTVQQLSGQQSSA